MGAPLPRFLRRFLLLSRARSALAEGALERALETAAAPELETDPDARALREAILDRLAQRAVQEHASAGTSAALELLAQHAPERALTLRRELAAAEARADAPAQHSSRTTLQALLAELRKSSSASTSMPGSPAPEAGAPLAPDALPQRGQIFHLAVDDAGEYLVAAGARFVLGHVRSRSAELAFLADLEREHAELRLEASFHGGERWRIVPLVLARPILVRGVPVPPEGVELAHGDRIELARNLAFHFVASESSSSSAIVELEHGVECRGALRVLLFPAGTAGRVRIGRQRRRLLTVSDLQHEIALEHGAGRLHVACTGGLRSGTESVEPGPDARISLPCPPLERVDLLLGARARPPFMLLLRPVAPDGTGATP